MKSIIKVSFLSAVILFIIASLSFAQDSTMKMGHQMKNNTMGMKGMQMDSMHMHSGKLMNNMKGMDSSIKEYTGVIDLKSLDINKDGKIYECPMDLNVLSDKPGVDPKCGMKLKEVNLSQAKKNLIKHGFKVK